MGPKESGYIEEETSAVIYPIQFVQVGKLQDVPAPLVRISTCGGIRLEVLREVMSTDPPQGRYQIVTLHKRPKGSSTGLTLLKILASLPEHYASKDWLTEHLPRTRSIADEEEEELGHGLIRVDNVVYLLRGLLCPLGINGEEALRKLLVAYIRNHRESGPGYRLAADPLVWLDVDVMTAATKQALRLEQVDNEALPWWEQVYVLASKGNYLPDEAYSDWAKDTRLRVEGYLRQAVHALHHLYLAHKGEAGEEQALMLLRSYWQTHSFDEDILRPLLELLRKRGRLHEADEYYQYLYQQLELEGRAPSLRTQQTIQNVRAGQQLSSLYLEEEMHIPTIVIDDVLRRDEEIPQQEQRDWPTWFGLHLAQILHTIRLWSKQTEDFTDKIQTVLDQEIKIMDETLEQFHVRDALRTSRRQVLITIAALPSMLASGLLTDAATEEFLAQSAAGIIACWHLLQDSGLPSINEIISRFVPTLRTLALHPSRYQQLAARLAAQTAILQAILAMHRLDAAAREGHCNDAIRYSDIAKEPRIQAAARMYLGYTLSFCYWPRKPEKAISVFQHALHILGNEQSLIRSDILMGMAEAYAQCKEEQQALHYIGLAQEYFPSYPEHDQSYFYAECGLTTLYQWEGKMYLELSEHYINRGYQTKARDSLVQSLGARTLSDRCTNETIIYQADAARVTGELDIYTTSLRTAVQMALGIGSKKRFNEALIVYQRTPQGWVNEPQVQALARDIFKQLPGGKQ